VDLARREGRAPEMLKELLSVAPKRLSGSPGAARAVEWGRAAMERAGFDRVWLETFPVPCWVRGDLQEAVARQGDATERLRVVALGGSVGTPPEGVEGEVVEVTSFEELRGIGDRARGKIVFFNRPMDPSDASTFRAYGNAVDQRSSGAVEAGRSGAVAALVRSMTTSLDDSPHTGAMRPYPSGVAKVPAAALSTTGAERLHAMAAKGPVRVRLRLSCETRDEVESANVLGEIRGSVRPDEVVLVGGHLDAWDVGEGAHDDGSGCVQAIEAIRLVKAAGIRPKRTIRAVLFMNEENGLRGGRDYAVRHKGELSKHVFAIESDRGGFAPRGFRTDAREPLYSEIAAFVSRLEPIGAARLEAGEGGGADIGPLGSEGVPLGELVPEATRYFDVHHSEKDVLSAVDPEELELGAAALAFLVSAIADRERPELPR
jgi:carboxypeptidase Q